MIDIYLETVSPLPPALSILGIKRALATGPAECHYLPFGAPASLTTSPMTSAPLPKHHLACADIAKAEAIFFLCSTCPLHHHCHPGHLLNEALPESPKQISLHLCLSSNYPFPLQWHHHVHIHAAELSHSQGTGPNPAVL